MLQECEVWALDAMQGVHDGDLAQFVAKGVAFAEENG